MYLQAVLFLSALLAYVIRKFFREEVQDITDSSYEADQSGSEAEAEEPESEEGESGETEAEEGEEPEALEPYVEVGPDAQEPEAEEPYVEVGPEPKKDL